MGAKAGAALGAAALLFVGLGSTEAALGAGSRVRVLEAEYMSVARGGMVRAPSAVNGRALALRPGGEARRAVRTLGVEAVAVRARVRRCRSASLLLRRDGGSWHRTRVRRRWSTRRVGLTLPAGAKVIRLRFGAPTRRRCRLLVDRVKLIPAPPGIVPDTPGSAPDPGGPVVRRALPLGSSVIVDKLLTDGPYSRALDTYYTSVTPENELKMEWLQPEENRFNFSAADALVDYAMSRGMAVRGHALIFGQQTPPWVGRKFFPEEVDAVMRNHIFEVMRRYAGRVRTWDVVNEALTDSGRFKRNPFFDKFGSRYVERAFRYARQADPTARLVYNEVNAERHGAKRDAMFGLVKSLKDKGLIDGVGFQMHTALGHAPSREQLEDTFRLFESIGVEIEITEMDVIAQGVGTPETLPERLARQAADYRAAATACAVVLACKALTVWGVSDRYSWQGAEQIPLLLDFNFEPKPAFDAVTSVIG